jgi:predicted RNase H-like HicB family nuclease
MKTEFKNIIWKEGKHYVAQCLNIEVSSFGETKDEAVKNLNEAIELYMEDASF